jgi:PIN domain nuclease of toxin-antitoxin system
VGSVTVPERPLLLDTAAFIFWHSDSPRLSSVARAALLEAPRRVVYVSAASAFEIATKVRLGKLVVPPPMLGDFGYVVEADGFRLLDIDAGAAIRAGQLESLHRDPFDRLIAAQALTLNGTVVTNDVAFAELGVPVLW